MKVESKIEDVKRSKKYADAMKGMGISSIKFPKYQNAENFGRQYKRTSIQKTANTKFSASL